MSLQNFMFLVILKGKMKHKQVINNTEKYIAELNSQISSFSQLPVKIKTIEYENRLLRQIVAASSNPIRITTEHGEIVYVNHAWEKLTGYTFDEVNGKNAIFLQSGKTPKKVYKQMWEYLNNNLPFETEDVIDRRKDGTEYRLHSSTFPVRTDNKTLYVQMHHDITTRKEQEETEHQLASLVKFSYDAIMGISLDLKFTSWNPAAETMYGYTEKEVLNKEVSLIIPKELLGEEKRLLLDNPVLSFETKRITKYGKIINVLITTSPVRDRDGKIIGFSAIHHDITEQLQILRKLIQSERRFRGVFNSMLQFLGLLSSDGILIDINKSGKAFLKTEQLDIFGKYFWDSDKFSKDLQKAIKNTIKKAKLGKFIKQQFLLPLRNGTTMAVDYSLTPIKDDSGKILFLLVEGRDVTMQKKLEQQKNTFLSIASHELKTPITTLKLMLDVFLKRFKENGIKTNELHIINKELLHLNELINDLLGISRIDSGKMKMQASEFDLTALTKKIINKMKLVAGKRKIIFTKYPNYIVSADPNRIGEVITNFLSNAIKYSPDYSVIIVQMKKSNKRIQVSVQDQGIGIPKAKIKHVFNRFYQIQEHGKGFGLGLYISKEIIKLHKGRIWVHSASGNGSTFLFSLPLVNK